MASAVFGISTEAAEVLSCRAEEAVVLPVPVLEGTDGLEVSLMITGTVPAFDAAGDEAAFDAAEDELPPDAAVDELAFDAAVDGAAPFGEELTSTFSVSETAASFSFSV